MAKTVWDGFGRRIGSVATLHDGKKHVYDANGHSHCWKPGYRLYLAEYSHPPHLSMWFLIV